MNVRSVTSWLRAQIVVLVVSDPASSEAIEIELSNPWYRVFNGITESRIDEDFATFAVFESGPVSRAIWVSLPTPSTPRLRATAMDSR
jgi:hypothetical protein